jgi:hypothetical protein
MEEQELSVFGNKLPKKIFGPDEDMEKTTNKELCNLYFTASACW